MENYRLSLMSFAIRCGRITSSATTRRSIETVTLAKLGLEDIRQNLTPCTDLLDPVRTDEAVWEAMAFYGLSQACRFCPLPRGILAPRHRSLSPALHWPTQVPG